MRVPYKCVCDKCKIEIRSANDENDVKLNSLEQHFCPGCYSDLCAVLERWGGPNWKPPTSKEQVIRGTPGESSAESNGFEIIERDEAFVDITVSSRVRQIGRSSITSIILQALAKVGYRNIHVVGDDNPGNLPLGFVENKHPDLRINLFDKDPRFC